MLLNMTYYTNDLQVKQGMVVEQEWFICIKFLYVMYAFVDCHWLIFYA